MVAEQLINTSTDAIARFRAHPDLKKFSHELESATAVVILPTVIKAGFFAGGEIAHHHLYGYTGVLTVFVANE